MRTSISAFIAIAAALVLGMAGDRRAAAMGSEEQWRYSHFVDGLRAAGPPSWSADGKSVAFVGWADHQMTVATVDLATGTVHGLCRGQSPRWSPKGDRIAFLDYQSGPGPGLYVIPSRGGLPRRVAGRPVWEGVEWSPDGRHLAFEALRQWVPQSGPMAYRRVSCGEVHLVEVASGAVSQLTNFADVLPPDAPQLSAKVVAWPPGGEILVLVRAAGRAASESGGPSGLYAVDPSTHRLRKLFGGEFARAFSSPDGRKVMLVRCPGRPPADAPEDATSEVQAEVLIGQIEEGNLQRVSATVQEDRFDIVAVSWPQGVAIATGGDAEPYSSVLLSIDLNTGQTQSLTPEGLLEGAPAVSPDGSQVAFYRFDESAPGSRGPHGDLHLASIDGQGARPVGGADGLDLVGETKRPTVAVSETEGPGAEGPEQADDGSSAKSMSALHEAALAGDVEEARRLLAGGAAPDAADEIGHTPLHVASYRGHAEVARVLIEAGARVNSRSVTGDTPLHLACEVGRAEVAQLLIGAGADVDARGQSGTTPLYLATTSQDATIVQLLVGLGADIHARARLGDTALHSAIREGHAAMVELLLEAGADVDARNELDETPLSLAIDGCRSVIAQLLIERGADIRARNGRRSTPLHGAAGGRCLVIAQLLLESGADASARDWRRDTPLHLALYRGDSVIAQLLVQKGADVNAIGERGASPLHLAAENGTADIVQLLLGQGAAVNAKEALGERPLHAATRAGRADIARLLIEAGADTNARSDLSGTPLAIALEHDYEVLADLLREHGGEE